MEMTRPYRAMDSPRATKIRLLPKVFSFSLLAAIAAGAAEATAMPADTGKTRSQSGSDQTDAQRAVVVIVGVDGLGSGGGSGGVGIGIIRSKDAQCAAAGHSGHDQDGNEQFAELGFHNGTLRNFLFYSAPLCQGAFAGAGHARPAASILSSDCGMVAGRTYPASTAHLMLLLSSNQRLRTCGRRPCSSG